MTPIPDTASQYANAIADLIRQWDIQQAAYIAHREHRFELIGDVLASILLADPLIVDLACGPGSLTARLLERLPTARVVAVDLDPVLLRIAREGMRRFGDRVTLLGCDLSSPGWVDALDGQVPAAAVSTTALHWLTPDELVGLYGQLGSLLPPGGVFLNGDHLRFGDDRPTLQQLALQVDAETQADSFASGALTWDQWWERAGAVPELGALIEVRDARFSGRPVPPDTSVEFHLAALRQAGFGEVGTVWQEFDDFVVFARR